jgi:hypothetical protein
MCTDQNPLEAHRRGYIAVTPSNPLPDRTYSFGGYSRRHPERLRQRSPDHALIVSMKQARWIAREDGFDVSAPGAAR